MPNKNSNDNGFITVWLLCLVLHAVLCWIVFKGAADHINQELNKLHL